MTESKKRELIKEAISLLERMAKNGASESELQEQLVEIKELQAIDANWEDDVSGAGHYYQLDDRNDCTNQLAY